MPGIAGHWRHRDKTAAKLKGLLDWKSRTNKMTVSQSMMYAKNEHCRDITRTLNVKEKRGQGKCALCICLENARIKWSGAQCRRGFISLLMLYIGLLWLLLVAIPR